MMTDRQADLDDLIASCRTENGKRAFAEAVACFRAGAYRAGVVATWTAVVFDYVGKLRELELAGNGQAKIILESFENARANEDVALSQKLEAAVLDEAATKFDLLTPIEKEDLERLRRDRHRCAHPSLQTLDDPYQPSAEAARAHLRHAAQHLLSRPPVQGREAYNRIWVDVTSEYFPEDVDGAEERLRSRMSRARASLIRQLAIELTKKLLDRDSHENHDRFRAALVALTRMHHTEVEKLLREKLSSIAEQVADADLRWLLEYSARYELAWGSVGAAAQQRLGAYVQKSDSLRVLRATARIPALWAQTVGRLAQLDADSVIDLAATSGKIEPVEEIVSRFETGKSYKAFSVLRKSLSSEPVRANITAAHARRLVAALQNNADLRRYMWYGSTAIEVFEAVGAPGVTTVAEWRPVHDLLMVDSPWAAKKLREHFTEIPAPPEEPPSAVEEPDESDPTDGTA